MFTTVLYWPFPKTQLRYDCKDQETFISYPLLCTKLNFQVWVGSNSIVSADFLIAGRVLKEPPESQYWEDPVVSSEAVRIHLGKSQVAFRK